jgi:hypothetical protein
MQEDAMQIRHAHSQALAALARISLTLGVAGCIERTPPVDEPIADAEADAALDALLDGTLPPVTPDAAIFVDAVVTADAQSDAVVAADAGVMPLDAEVDMPPCSFIDRVENPEEFWACCEASGFPPGPCSPWGPPTPPSMVLA